MRGNEVGQAEVMRRAGKVFSIPMRGNEVMDDMRREINEARFRSP